MKETLIERCTRIFFWCGYAVFLAASIPHIATYFRHFDPMNTSSDTFYWIIGYALALVIDISDVLVSIAVIKAQANGARTRDLFGYWLFIGFITALSWMINWQYNVVFGSSQFHVVDVYTVFGLFTIGQLNPVIGSAFQLLLLVYTGMAHKFSQKSEYHEKSLDELRQEAAEAREKAGYVAVIREAHKTVTPSFLTKTKATLSELNDIRKEVFSSDEKGTFPPAIPAPINAIIEPQKERYTDPLLEQVIAGEDEQIDTPVTDRKEHEKTVILDDEKALDTAPSDWQKDEDKNTSSRRDSGRSTVTIEDAAMMLDVTVKQVKIWRTKGTLKTAPRNKELLTIKSINALTESRLKTRNKTDITEPINNNHNGHTQQVEMRELVTVKV